MTQTKKKSDMVNNSKTPTPKSVRNGQNGKRKQVNI